MDTDRLAYGLIAVLVGFGMGFLAGFTRQRRALQQARTAAETASKNTAYLMEMELMHNDAYLQTPPEGNA